MKKLKCFNWKASLAIVSILIILYTLLSQHDELHLVHLSGTVAYMNHTIKSKSTNQKEEHMFSLPKEVVSGVRLFVLFVGNTRSGHSIIGSFLDAHPNVVMAHQFNVFRWMDKASQNVSKSQLFNELFQNSYDTVFKDDGTRRNNNKGYNLTMDIDSWQGRYRDRIDVIGDKRGGTSSNMYSKQPELFLQLYEKLKQVISIPIHFIHCVRNPYDIISTSVLYSSIYKTQDFKVNRLKNGAMVQSKVYKNDTLLADQIKKQFRFADSVLDLSQSLIDRHSLLEVHNHELVYHPEETILKLCQFLKIECSSDYVKSCASKVFPELSRTRFTVYWSEEAKKMVQERIQKYPFFKRYSYDSAV